MVTVPPPRPPVFRRVAATGQPCFVEQVPVTSDETRCQLAAPPPWSVVGVGAGVEPPGVVPVLATWPPRWGGAVGPAWEPEPATSMCVIVKPIRNRPSAAAAPIAISRARLPRERGGSGAEMGGAGEP